MESSKTNQPTSGVVAQPQKKTVSAKEIVADIKSGMSDRSLEQKYQLDQSGLDNLFSKLISAKFITEEELRGRRNVVKDQTIPVPSTIRQNGTVAIPQSQTTTTSLMSFGLHDVKIVAVGAILGGISAAVVTSYWGTAKTWTKWLGKAHGGTSWKWIIACAIIGAILAFYVDWILKKRRIMRTSNQPLPVTKASQSGKVSAEEIEKAIIIMQQRPQGHVRYCRRHRDPWHRRSRRRDSRDSGSSLLWGHKDLGGYHGGKMDGIQFSRRYTLEMDRRVCNRRSNSVLLS